MHEMDKKINEKSLLFSLVNKINIKAAEIIDNKYINIYLLFFIDMLRGYFLSKSLA